MPNHTEGEMGDRQAGTARRIAAQADGPEPDCFAAGPLDAEAGSGPRVGQALPAGSPRAGRGGPLRVAVLAHPPGEAPGVAGRFLRLPEVAMCDRLDDRAQVILCAAGSAWRLVELLDSGLRPCAEPKDRHKAVEHRAKVIEYEAPVALLDLTGEIGPQATALHALHGYLAPGLRPEECLPCLRSAARQRPYAAAPEEHADAYYDVMADGPLTVLERQILGCAALGFTQPEWARRLRLGLSTLEAHEKLLKEKLEMDSRQHLAAAAVELGFYRHWSLADSP